MEWLELGCSRLIETSEKMKDLCLRFARKHDFLGFRIFPKQLLLFIKKNIWKNSREKQKRKSQWDRFIDRGSVGSILEIE